MLDGDWSSDVCSSDLANYFDMLIATYCAPTASVFTTDNGEEAFTLCTNCHDAGGPSTKNVLSSYQGTFASVPRAGHRLLMASTRVVVTNTANLIYPANYKMPCYVCHGNPHDAGYKMHNEELDADLVTRTVTSQRLFCVACHREDDTSRATPSVVKKYLGFELKKLPAMGAAHKLGTTTPCTNCHLDEHKPVPGESQGGQACVDCHDSTDNTGYSGTISATMTTANNATSRHMISSTIASYTSYGPGRTCLMCHVDHDKFSPVVVPTNTRAANLKRDGTAGTTATVATASTDFNASYAAGGTCAS
jgi:hypothetical protein